MDLSKKISLTIRFFINLVVNSIGVYLISLFIPGIYFENLLVTAVAVFLIAILNSIIFPIFNRFALPLTVYTLGIAGLILNGVIILFVASIMPEFKVESLLSGIILVFGITLVNTIITELLAIDDDETFFRNVIEKQAKKNKDKNINKTPGVIFIQIDGLSHNVLRRAIQSGNVPNISKWLRDGEYRLEKWETDWSSQTGASQAGLLMGNNDNIRRRRDYQNNRSPSE